MPLQKSIIPVQFSGGIDTKTADQLVVPGSFHKLENCVRKKTGKIEKRFGFGALPKTVSGGSPIIEGRHLDQFDDTPLLFDGFQSYAFSSGANTWINRGTAEVANGASYSVVRDTHNQSESDIAFNDGLATAVYYSDTYNQLNYSINEDSTGAGIVIDAQLSDVGRRARVVAIGSQFFLLYQIGTDIHFRTVGITNPSVISGEVFLGLGDVGNFPWDIVQYDAFRAVLVYNTTAGNIKFVYLLQNGTIGNNLNGSAAPLTIAANARKVLSISADSTTGRIFTAEFPNTAGIQPATIRGVTADFSFQSSATVTTSNTVVIPNVEPSIATGTVTVIPGGNAHIFFGTDFTGSTLTPANSFDSFIQTREYSWAVLGAITAVNILHGVLEQAGIWSKAFNQDGRVYLLATVQSAFQSSYFLVRNDGWILGKFFNAFGAGLQKDHTGAYTSMLPRVVPGSLGLITSVGVAGKLQALNNVIQTVDKGITRLGFDLSSSFFRGVQAAFNYQLAGGILQGYDGATFIEQNFLLFPEYTTATAVVDGSGMLAPGSYQVTMIYEWYDAKGQVVRSAPDIPQTVVVGGGGTNAIEVDGQPLLITNRKVPNPVNKRSSINVVIYRSLVNQPDVLYRAATVSNDNLGSPILTGDDASISSNEVLYTTGGVLDNSPAPPGAVVVTHKNRVWVADYEGGLELAYSKTITIGEGLAFNDGQRIEVDPLGGRVTALSSLDDKLVIFKKNRLFYLAGDGPLDTGAQNDFTTPQVISAEVGCNNPDSIVILPVGVMFKSDKGIYLLTRNLTTEYIGAPVEDFNGLMISSAVVVEDENEIRFTTSDGECLVYNYYFNQWSTFTNFAATGAASILASYYHLKSDGTVYKESADYLDAGAKIHMAIETSWLAFAGVQGFQRIYRIEGLGDFITPHYTHISIAYDYENAFTENIFYNVDAGLQISYYGDDPYYGGSPVYGGVGSGVYRWSTKPRRQKCEAIRLRLEDVDTVTPGGGGSFTLVALTFEAGVKGTVDKVGGTEQIGS